MIEAVSGLIVTEGYYCPLLNKKILESYSYEINSVAFGLCKPSLIAHVTSREKAEAVCEMCENKAM